MKTKKEFSVIELMTVILVILILLTLLIPFFIGLKKNARTALCKNQMRQMSVLLTSYASENSGYLPNDKKSDIKSNGASNNVFYANWNGHLLPYLDSGVNSYHRLAVLSVNDGNVKVGGIKKLSSESAFDPVTKSDVGWSIINETFHNGGFNDLKLFICPEIHANTYDVGVSKDFNDLRIPRISQLSSTYIGNQGVPTTYFANDIFFGFDGHYNQVVNSLRLDQINSVSQKALLIEGGLAYAKLTNGEPDYVYYRLSYNLTTNDLGGNINKTLTGDHRMNYCHDAGDPFWYMDGNDNYFPSPWMDINSKRELAVKFNLAFEGKASMIEGHHGGFCIFSKLDPASKPFDNFFIANPPNAPLTNFDLYDEPEFHYLSGKMNVLFGDGSVETKDHSWLSMNRMKISQLTNE